MKAIQGNWTYGDNLAKFNELTANGATPEAAAAQTLTGQRAKDYGFTQISLVSEPKGTVDHYTEVRIKLER